MSSEAAVQQNVRLQASEQDDLLWRNNQGACYDESGRLIRYGLGNDSAQVNKRIKSSDLIGITKVVVTPDMVGQVIGVFTAIEVKASTWKPRPSDQRVAAQGRFIDVVREYGGIAGFATSGDEYKRIVGK